jgi:hypothetical protein
LKVSEELYWAHELVHDSKESLRNSLALVDIQIQRDLFCQKPNCSAFNRVTGTTISKIVKNSDNLQLGS